MKNNKWESWKQRIGDEEGLWSRTAYERIWVVISNQNSMEIDTEQQVHTFQMLTPGNKYKLIKDITKPQNIQYNKDGTVSVQVNRNEANKLLNINELASFKVAIKKHPYRNLVRGVIKANFLIPSPEQEILEGLAEDNCVKVRKELKPKRDQNDKVEKDENGKVILEPNSFVVITLESETLPKEVKIFGNHLPVTQFEPLPTQCRKCYQLGKCRKFIEGKMENNCQAQEICGYCGEPKHTENNEKCKNEAKCHNYMRNHAAWSRGCPVYVYEKEVLKIKEVQKIPYPRAKAILDERRASSEKQQNTANKASTQTISKHEHDQILRKTIEDYDKHYHQERNLNQNCVTQLDQQVNSLSQKVSELADLIRGLLAVITPQVNELAKSQPNVIEIVTNATKRLTTVMATRLPPPAYTSRSYGNIDLDSETPESKRRKQELENTGKHKPPDNK